MPRISVCVRAGAKGNIVEDARRVLREVGGGSWKEEEVAEPSHGAAGAPRTTKR